VRPQKRAQHSAGKLKATPFARQLSVILAHPKTTRTTIHPIADVLLRMRQRDRGRHPAMLETLLVTNKAIISFLNQTMSSRILGPNFLPGSGPSILRYPDHRLLLLHRLLHRTTDLAKKTAFVTSVESMAVALPMLSQSIIACHPTGSDTRFAAKNLKSTRDNSANKSRGKNSVVPHHKSNDNILMADSDTLSGDVDVTKTPRTSRSIVTAAAEIITVETHRGRIEASSSAPQDYNPTAMTNQRHFSYTIPYKSLIDIFLYTNAAPQHTGVNIDSSPCHG
jgi:hypothetical protein